MDKKNYIFISLVSLLLILTMPASMNSVSTESTVKYKVVGLHMVQYNLMCNGNNGWLGNVKLKLKGAFINLNGFSMTVNKTKANNNIPTKLSAMGTSWTRTRSSSVFKIYKKPKGFLRGKLKLPIITASGQVQSPVKVTPKNGSKVSLKRDDKYLAISWTPTNDKVSVMISECPGGNCGAQPQFFQRYNIQESSVRVPSTEFKTNTYYKIIILQRNKNLFTFSGQFATGSFIDSVVENSIRIKILKKGELTLRR